MNTTITMTETISTSVLLRLTAWMSPAFPVGAFAYSHGLERAVEDRLVFDGETLRNWLGDLLTIGSAWNDAVLFSECWRRHADSADLRDMAALAEALATSSERWLETVRQGSAFVRAARAWPHPVCDILPADCPMPVAAGAVSGAHAAALEPALATYLQAFTGNQIQAALRLMPLGQQRGVEVLAALEDTIQATAQRAMTTTADDLGSATLGAEIAALRHETQASRLFRS